MNSVQPISTAPKDGTFIIVFGPSGYTSVPIRCEVCRWEGERRSANWRTYGGDAFTDSGEEPTHWMPIPRTGWEPLRDWPRAMWSVEETREHHKINEVRREMKEFFDKQKEVRS